MEEKSRRMMITLQTSVLQRSMLCIGICQVTCPLLQSLMRLIKKEKRCRSQDLTFRLSWVCR